MSEEIQDIRGELQPLFKEHDYNKTYSILSIVTHTIGDIICFYQAIRSVPRLIPITDNTYWRLINQAGADNIEPEEPEDPTDYLCFTAERAGATLRLAGSYYPNRYNGNPFNLEYSFDKKHWTSLVFNITYSYGSGEDLNQQLESNIIIFNNIGDKVYFRGDNINGSSFYDRENYSGALYNFHFISGDNTKENIFSVTGDLQTIVSKTGEDKEHGCFDSLFATVSYDRPCYITTAPKLTATKLCYYKYTYLFGGQSYLTFPAEMPSFTIEDFTQNDHAFGAMYYNCSNLQQPFLFDNLTSDVISSYDDYLLIISNINDMYSETTFDITEDNGNTIKGFPTLAFPMSLSYQGTTTIHHSYSFCNTLGNNYGFHVFIARISEFGSGIRHSITSNATCVSYNPSGNYSRYVYIINEANQTAVLTCFKSFQQTVNIDHWERGTGPDYRHITWDTTIPDSASTTITIEMEDGKDYYYRAIEAVSEQ